LALRSRRSRVDAAVITSGARGRRKALALVAGGCSRAGMSSAPSDRDMG
jgi:hypothetical protein